MKLQAIRGMNDIGAPEIYLWQHIESVLRDVAAAYGFHEVRPPLLEPTSLFKRGVGEVTDIVEKEMYSFTDRGGDDISLRPEGTASIVRAVLEHSWLNDSPVLKIYYMGPMYRYERPQKGRYRQFYQFGLEIFGAEGPRADVEVLAIQNTIFQRLKVSGLELRISSLGDSSCRPTYRTKLMAMLESKKSQLCEDCQRRMTKNPMRIFDCKNKGCQEIAKTLPLMLDHLCEPCKEHFAQVQAGLKNLNIPFVIDPKIVRGLDYYTRTAFEYVSSDIGAQGAVCGGGRYDNLVEDMGGAKTPAIGLGLGLERLALLLEKQIDQFTPALDVFCICVDETARPTLQKLTDELRTQGIRTEWDLLDRGFKPQIKKADKLGAHFTLIMGGTELQKGIIQLKNMKTGDQKEVSLNQIVERLKDEIRQST